MADSQVMLGFLVPLNNSLDEDGSLLKIPVFEGVNVIGRNNVTVSDKRVSRKHVSLNASIDGSADVLVDGSNPVVIRTGDKRMKLSSQEKVKISHGDIIELIPGHYIFKYSPLIDEKCTSSSNTIKRPSAGGKLSEDEILTLKRKKQVSEDEAFARNLQVELAGNICDRESFLVDNGADKSQMDTVLASHEGLEPIRHFSVPKDNLHLTFRLLEVQGLPAWTNSSSVSIGDVIQGNVLIAVLSNYMVDLDWLISACPILKKIPRVLVIHGEGDGTLDHLKRNKPANWVLHKPPLPISYGTHHSKAMLLVYPKGVRIVVHTANLIYVDWNNKSQGLWMQDFPWKDGKDLHKGCGFENDLMDYLNTLKWPEFIVNLPALGNVNMSPSFFKKFDYSNAAVRLIASVPGYHVGSNLKRWGHMKLRSVLQDCIFGKDFQKSPLIYQFSSLGSLDEKWMDELASSMSSGYSDDKTPLGLGKAQIIWPTVEDVRCSLEGYAAGNAIPSPQKNVEKDFLKKYWARWKASYTGRCRAMPHIKTYTRYSGQNLAWLLLTSANLSKAAWGALQKNNSQLMIRSYELGVLFIPSTFKRGGGFSCTDYGDSTEAKCGSSENAEGKRTKLVTLCWQGSKGTDSLSEVIPLPVPYELPPQPYTSEDVPWSWDRRYEKKDVYGQVWPRHVKLYACQGEFTIEAGVKDTVLQIKQKIEQITGVPVASQNLTVCGWELIDGLDMEDYPIIIEGTKIYLAVTPLPLSKIQITVKFSTRRIDMEVDSTDTVGSLKEKIHIVDGTPIKRMILFFSGTELEEDYRNLLEYGICDQSEIIVYLKAASRVRVEAYLGRLNFVVQTSSTLLNSTSIPMEMKDACTISELRRLLLDAGILPSDDYFFIHKQRIMRDDCSLRWHGVENGDSLYVFKGTVTRTY